MSTNLLMDLIVPNAWKGLGNNIEEKYLTWNVDWYKMFIRHYHTLFRYKGKKSFDWNCGCERRISKARDYWTWTCSFKSKPADALTKVGNCPALNEILETGIMILEEKHWAVRKTYLRVNQVCDSKKPELESLPHCTFVFQLIRKQQWVSFIFKNEMKPIWHI